MNCNSSFKHLIVILITVFALSCYNNDKKQSTHKEDVEHSSKVDKEHHHHDNSGESDKHISRVDTSERKGEHNNKHNSNEWKYVGENSPEHWSHLNKAFAPCDGKMQSPVDIKNAEIDNSLKEIEFNYDISGGYKAGHSGNNILIKCPKGNIIKYGKDTFQLRLLSFHSLSEHTINGKHYDMEIQLAHISADKKFFIVSIFVVKGKENVFLKAFWDSLPTERGEQIISPTEVHPIDLLPTMKGYYIYDGSLSNPPCKEGVIRVVMKNPIEASEEQISKYISVISDKCYRPVQDLNGRKIREYKPK